MRNLFSGVLMLAVILSGCNVARKSDKISVDAVKTMNGMISGVPGNDPQVKIFKRIPFAAPPVGDLRWKEPQPSANWEGTRACDKFGPNAMQAKPVPRGVYTAEFLIPVDGQVSEDCLYLNVWTNAASVNDNKPVIVFMHGGGFTEGSGSVPIYDGEAMAKKGVVFVTINYRLGIFGFFAHPELTKESPHQASGNYGILDQIAALNWVKNNIAAFGGNPENVTIAGQSAGSMSVNVLAATPLAKGLFHRMIAESGANVLVGAFGGTDSLKSAESKGLELAKAAGAASLEALRQVPVGEMQKLLKGMGSVIVDGYVLTEPIPAIFAKGNQTDVPLLTGWNADDALFAMPVTLKAYKESIQKQYGTDAESILKFYPATSDSEATIALKNLSRDMSFGIQNYGWARMQSEKNTTRVFLYFFEREVPEADGKSQYGAFHSGEITYAYDNHNMFNRPWEPADYDLAKLMSSYWANFAANGDPNGTGLPEWPAFSINTSMIMDFNVKSEAMKHPNSDALQFLFYRITGK